MLITWLHLRVQPHKRPELMSAVDHLLLQMRRAPGCARGRLFEDTEDPNMLLVVSEWENRQNVNAFLASNDFQIFRGAQLHSRRDLFRQKLEQQFGHSKPI
jgi:quinol monooxygenase YgiN